VRDDRDVADVLSSGGFSQSDFPSNEMPSRTMHMPCAEFEAILKPSKVACGTSGVNCGAAGGCNQKCESISVSVANHFPEPAMQGPKGRQYVGPAFRFPAQPDKNWGALHVRSDIQNTFDLGRLQADELLYGRLNLPRAAERLALLVVIHRKKLLPVGRQEQHARE
jgi:hypothetical protein